jgi:nitrate reductase gamma subunit
MLPLLRIGVLMAGGWAALALVTQVWRTGAYGRPRFLAWPAGSRGRAIAYAFGAGMLPGAKESVREHLPIWLAGVGFHAGVLGSLLLLGSRVADAAVNGVALRALQMVALTGVLCGCLLLLRRARHPRLRGLSVPDDVVSNMLTTGFCALALGATLLPVLETWLLIEAIILFVYVPMGKIRHCIFFFATRCHAAVFFGRRGVLPPAG